MYRRYSPRPVSHPQKQGKPPIGEMATPAHNNSVSPKTRAKHSSFTSTPVSNEKKVSLNKNSLLSFIPTSLYNPETKKVLGKFSAEDLLLVAMILVLLDSDCSDDSMLVLALIYILLSDYIDLPI